MTLAHGPAAKTEFAERRRATSQTIWRPRRRSAICEDATPSARWAHGPGGPCSVRCAQRPTPSRRQRHDQQSPGQLCRHRIQPNKAGSKLSGIATVRCDVSRRDARSGAGDVPPPVGVRSVLLFLLAALAEIGGAWLVWRGGASTAGSCDGGRGGGARGVRLRRHPAADPHFGGGVAAYGGVFVVRSLVGAWCSTATARPLRLPRRRALPPRGRSRDHVCAARLMQRVVVGSERARSVPEDLRVCGDKRQVCRGTAPGGPERRPGGHPRVRRARPASLWAARTQTGARHRRLPPSARLPRLRRAARTARRYFSDDGGGVTMRILSIIWLASLAVNVVVWGPECSATNDE